MTALLCTTAPPLTENAVQRAGEIHPQKHKQTERCIATLNPDTVIMCTACLQESFYSPGNKTRAHPHVAPKQQLTFGKWQQEISSGDFSFFIANMSSMLPASLKKSLGKAGVGTFYYTCAGYNYALVLENLVWQERFLKENKREASTF